MAFMEKLGNVAKSIGEMAGDAIEMAKIEAKQKSAETAYKEELKKIGEFYCAVYRAGGQLAPEIEETVKAAVANYDIVIEQQKLIDSINQEKALEKMAAQEARKEEKLAAKEAKKAEKLAAKEAARLAEEAEAEQFMEAEPVEAEVIEEPVASEPVEVQQEEQPAE